VGRRHRLMARHFLPRFALFQGLAAPFASELSAWVLGAGCTCVLNRVAPLGRFARVFMAFLAIICARRYFHSEGREVGGKNAIGWRSCAASVFPCVELLRSVDARSTATNHCAPIFCFCQEIVRPLRFRRTKMPAGHGRGTHRWAATASAVDKGPLLRRRTASTNVPYARPLGSVQGASGNGRPYRESIGVRAQRATVQFCFITHKDCVGLSPDGDGHSLRSFR
jgi:hypothetical protein